MGGGTTSGFPGWDIFRSISFAKASSSSLLQKLLLHHLFAFDKHFMFIRRAESKDIAEIKELIKGGFGRDDMERVLKRRYGDNYNLDYIM